MEFTKVITNRYSCKNFSDRPVPDEKLQAILEAGRVAPTAKNLQEQRIYVISSPEGLAKIDELTPCRYNAPTVLLIACDESSVFTYPNDTMHSGIEDVSIVATHMMLAAYDAGIDSCWLNFFCPEDVKKAFSLPDNERVVLLLDLGYAADGAGPLPNHGNRKALSETVTYLH